MLRRVLVAVLLTAATIVALGVAASTQESTSSGVTGGETDSLTAPAANDEHLQLQQARLAEQRQRVEQALLLQRALVEDLRQRTAQASLDHQERMRRELGPRAPTETVPPMATIPPPPD